MSELYGRQPAYLVSQVLMVFFCLGTALASKSVNSRYHILGIQLILQYPNVDHIAFASSYRLRTFSWLISSFAGMWSSVGPALGVATCADVRSSHPHPQTLA
jgi:hypothetical protein